MKYAIFDASAIKRNGSIKVKRIRVRYSPVKIGKQTKSLPFLRINGYKFNFFAQKQMFFVFFLAKIKLLPYI